MKDKRCEGLYVYRRELVTHWELREPIPDLPLPPDVPIRGPKDLLPYLTPWAQKPEEHFLVVLLNCRMKVMGHAVVSQGTRTNTHADPGLTARALLMGGAAAGVLVHNHPSGSLDPSQEDIEVTKETMAACRAVGVPILDHVILGLKTEGPSVLSLREAGLLPYVS